MGVQLRHAFPSICIMTWCMIPVNLTMRVDHSVSDNKVGATCVEKEREREREGGEEEREGREDINHHGYLVPSSTT